MSAQTPRCPGHARHWFIERGTVGLRRPTCLRCGATNPRPLSQQELAEFEGYVEHRESVRAEAQADAIKALFG